MTRSSDRIGVVVIGRNEGDRLRQCLASPALRNQQVIYVDSGSTDQSVAVARDFDASVVQLDTDRPFTAARARNAGAREVMKLHPGTSYIQFVDGDCELNEDWLEIAEEYLTSHSEVAVVFGRLRERYPEASAYNRLCQIEWDTPIGETSSSGGIAMMRADPFSKAGGFRKDLIAGEEPDLCHRFRQQGWKIHKLDSEMALHDAAMMTVGQWWARNKRSGYSTAQAFSLRGASEPSLKRKVFSNIVWALPPLWPLWPLLWWRSARLHGPAYATHIVAGKIPHLQGQIAYWLNTALRRNGAIIEHK